MSLRQGREGLANYDAKMPSNFMSATQPTKVGQVVGIIMGENLPTPTQYQKAAVLNTGRDNVYEIHEDF
jgi:hypothetical protein